MIVSKLLLIFSVTFTMAQANSNFFQVMCENRIPNATTIISTVRDMTRRSCALFCYSKASCRSFGFQRMENLCYLSNGFVVLCDRLQQMTGIDVFMPGSRLRFPMDTISSQKLLGDIDATLYNSPTLVPGVLGSAMLFNGVNQWADLGLYSCFSDVAQCTDGYSFVVWLKTSSTAAYAFIMSSGGQTIYVVKGGMALLLKESKLKVMFTVRPLNKRWARENIEIPLGEWFHFAATWHQDGSLATFLNGEFLESTDEFIISLRSTTESSDMHIGKANHAGSTYGDFAIDEWYFWNYVLDTESVKMIYDQY